MKVNKFSENKGVLLKETTRKITRKMSAGLPLTKNIITP